LGDQVVCKNQWDCNPGFHCDTATNPPKCQAQKTLGSQCDSDESCLNDLLCVNNKCIQLFSLGLNQPVVEELVNSKTGFNLVCQTGYAVYSGNTYNCTKAPTSTEKLPVACTPGSNCTSSDEKYSKSCTCAYNEAGSSYCPLFEGDPIAVSMIKNWLAMNNVNEKCNAHNPWSYQCFATLSTTAQQLWYSWAIDYWQYAYNYYPLIQGNDECSQSIFTQSYWDISKASTTFQKPQCPAYFCNTPTKDWSSDQCGFYEKNIDSYKISEIYYINECAHHNQTCVVDSQKNATCDVLDQNTRYPGDYCEKDEQCISGSCSDKECVGKVYDQECTNTYDCNPGLYCNMTANTCKYQVEEGGDCDHWYECRNNLTCNLGQCIPYFSLSAESIVDDVQTSTGKSYSCYYGFANVTSTSPPRGVCMKAPVSAAKLDEPCTPGSTCVDTTGKYSKNCQCGYNEWSQAYCPVFEGDAPWQNSISLLKRLHKVNLKCNTNSRHGEFCFLKIDGYHQLYYQYSTNYTTYLQGPQLQYNPDCIKTTITSQYWLDLQNSYIKEAGMILTAISFVFGVLVL